MLQSHIQYLRNAIITLKNLQYHDREDFTNLEENISGIMWEIEKKREKTNPDRVLNLLRDCKTRISRVSKMYGHSACETFWSDSRNDAVLAIQEILQYDSPPSNPPDLFRGIQWKID
jgi:hypothetical protein